MERWTRQKQKHSLSQELSRYRELPYAELFASIDHSETVERTAPSGVIYQIKMQVVIDDAARQTLLVMGAIDDGGWRAFSPLSDSFILSPDGSFFGE